MTPAIEIMLSSSTFYMLAGLVAASLFFLMVGIRELQGERMEGLLYLVLSLFFAAVHLFYLFTLPIDNILTIVTAQLTFWDWSSLIFGPALIALFISFGLFAIIRTDSRAALMKIFFGMTLLCYLYMLGPDWPTDVRGIIVIVWSLIWVKVELVTAA